MCWTIQQGIFCFFISIIVQRPEYKEPEYHAQDTIDTEKTLLAGSELSLETII